MENSKQEKRLSQPAFLPFQPSDPFKSHSIITIVNWYRNSGRTPHRKNPIETGSGYS